ncbi:MAG: T9SS type A sorting domain-containing protein [Cyclobacteriaceae bacterium]|nr:T9SS type A sorting domain-containing protein [Cyclobacteriaceae bacterium]
MTQKALLALAGLLLTVQLSFAQNTVTSGNWSDPTVWSGGAVPAAGGTVNVNNPLTIDASLSPTGVWTFNSNSTDQPGGTKYTFNPNAGTNALTIIAGVTVTFEGGTAGTPNIFNSGTIEVYGTLILGYTELRNDVNLNINVRPGGTLIINGDLTNKNNSGTLVVGGAVQINGNYDGQTGSTTLSGSGTINTTGTITTNGGSTVFGFTNDCSKGPCSGSTLSCTFDNYISPTAVTQCSGTSGVVFTSNPLGGGNLPASPAYQWESSTDNITFGNASGTSTNATYTTPALAVTTYYRLKIVSGGCTSRSAAAVITVLGSGGWIGATSNWATASNWCGNSVPTSTTDVVITNGAGISAMPVINAGTAAAVRNLTLSNTNPSSTVTIAAAANASLSIYGNFTNNGGLTDNSTASTAGVILAGSTPQTLDGLYPTTFNNLTVNNTSGATPAVTLSSNNLKISSNLTLTAGKFNLNGFTATLGVSAASAGTLTYTAGQLYGGNIERWYPTTAVTIGTTASLFPIGTGTDYRPLYFGSTGLGTGGTIKVRHTNVANSTVVAFSDGATPIQKRSNSFWTVTTGNGIASGGTPLSLRTEGTGFGTVGDVADLRITLSGAASPGSDGAHAGTTLNPQVNRTGLSLANISNSFYWGSINGTQTPLPVGLLKFTGENIQGHVDLSWTTASELNNDHFTVFHSKDGESFQPISSIKGKGTTAAQSDYRLTHFSPSVGSNYYMLQQTDFNGHSTDLKLIMVKVLQGEPTIQVFPNPVNSRDLFYLALDNFLPDFATEVQILNIQGQVVNAFRIQTGSNGQANYALKSELSPGVYILKVGAYQIRIVVQ